MTEKAQAVIDNPLGSAKIALGMVQQTCLDVLGYGESVFEREWDLLVVLDACRPDILKEVSSDYGFINDVDTMYSKGSYSKQWLQRNFTTKYAKTLAKTAYVTGNPYTSQVETSLLGLCDEVWKYGWDSKLGTIPPRPITDRAITLHREQKFDHLIVHYMQPHFPSIVKDGFGARIDPEKISTTEKTIFQQLKDGEISREEVWNAYRQNLIYVLNEVRILLSNINAETVVLTADHGNGFGERGIYGHPAHRIHSCLRKVPWMETTATDSRSHIPETYSKQSNVDASERLSSLGYLD